MCETITAKTLADVGSHTHLLTSREIICADNISIAAIDSGGNVAVPVPVILANPTAITESPAGLSCCCYINFSNIYKYSRNASHALGHDITQYKSK